MILEELHDFFDHCHDKFWKRWKDEYNQLNLDWPLENHGGTATTDSNGIATLHCFKNNTDRPCLIHRVALLSPDYNPGSVIVSATAYAYLFKGEQFSLPSVIDFFPNSPNEQVVPNIWAENGDKRPIINPGEILSLYFNLGSSFASHQILTLTSGTFYNKMQLLKKVY